MNSRKSLFNLIEEIKITTNPVTYWALKCCIFDRLNRKDYS